MSKKIKIHGLFKKKYTEKQYKNKILKKVFVPADKAFIESVFVTTTDPKKGHTLYTVPEESITDAAVAKRLEIIGKQIKKQKGRFNLFAIIAAILCVTALCLALTVFRNQIARIVLTNILEGSFGARCEMGVIDFDLIRTHFRVDNLTVANKKTPMKNLFSIAKTELDFDILELSRGKIISKNVEFTGITWNTDRTVSGTLPPKKQKAYDKKQKTGSNPVSDMIQTQVNNLKSGVSVDSGIEAVLDQLDPIQFFENEKAALQSPAIIQNIMETVPALYSKWEDKTKQIRTEVDTAILAGKKLTTLKVDSINTLEETQAIVIEIQAAITVTEKTTKVAQNTLTDIGEDTKKISTLAKEAEAAVKADAAHIKALADSIKEMDLKAGKKIVSGVFNTFIINTLGTYYPYAEKGLGLLQNLQNNVKKEKKQSLKSKSKVIDRLPGRNFVFGKDSMPRLYFQNVALSVSDAKIGISGSAVVKHITDDADRINKPLLIVLDVAHGKMTENMSGTIDLRTDAPVLVDTLITGAGYPLDLQAGKQTGVPSITGNIAAKGSFTVSNDQTVRIATQLVVSEARATVAAFKPAIIYNAYADILSSVQKIDLDVLATINKKDGLQIDMNTDLDAVLYKAMKDQLAKQIEQFKAGVRREGEAFLLREKQKYTAEITRITDITTKSKAALADIQNYQATLEAKKTETEKKVATIIAEKTAAIQKAATDAADAAAKAATKAANDAAKDATKKGEKAAKDATKKLF